MMPSSSQEEEDDRSCRQSSKVEVGAQEESSRDVRNERRCNRFGKPGRKRLLEFLSLKMMKKRTDGILSAQERRLNFSMTRSNKFSFARSNETSVSKDKGGEEEEKEEDEFMAFYKQYRPEFNKNLARNFSSPSMGTCTPGGNSLARFDQSLSRRSQHPMIKSHSNETETTEDSSISNTSPLQGLSGLLSEKMSFGQSNQYHNRWLEECQSRDSGNSSGGSPDWRGVRRRNWKRDWYNNFEDRHTLHDLADPADIILESATQSLASSERNSVYSTGRASSKFCDSLSQTGMSHATEDWNPCLRERNLDRIRDCDEVTRSMGRESSVSRSSNYDNISEDKSGQRLSKPRPVQDSERSPIARILSVLWLLCRGAILVSSLALMVFMVVFIWRNYNCQANREVHLDVSSLEKAMNSRLFGQSLASQEILSGVNEFIANKSPVMVFYLTGWLGSGKTFTTSLIRQFFPLKENIHHFSVPLHFAKNSDHFQILDDLSLHIGRSCGHSLVIFDDIDGGSAETVQRIEQFVTTVKNTQLSSRSNGTLVFLTSNTGGRIINTHVLNVMKEGKDKREMVTYKDVMEEFQREGLELPLCEKLIAQGVSVKVVPFLPLTRDHVELCVRQEMRSQGVSASAKEVKKLVDDMGYFAPELPVLAKAGCKQVANKVDVLLGVQDPYFQG